MGRRVAPTRPFGLYIVLAAVSACGGSAPTDGGPTTTGSNEIRFDDGRGLLRAHEATIRELLAGALSRVTAVLPLDGVTITIAPDASRAIPGWGVGGHTPSGRMIEISVDPGFPGLAQILPRLPPLAAHELHHARRWRGPGYGRTLLEALVSEGLADHFAIELLGAPVPPWSDAFPREETARFIELARPEFDSTAYDHDRWFFLASATLPRWTGYTLGFRIVEAYEAAHPGATAAGLVDTPASQFRP